MLVLEAAAKKHGFSLTWDHFPWSCVYYQETGRMMPKDGLAQIRDHDAIYLGAVGFPGVPDHVSLWGLLIPIRREFRQYANVRPVRLMPGIESPLRNRHPGDIDFYVIRENNEGNTPKSAAVSTPVATMRLRCSRSCSPATAWTAFFATRLSWRAVDRRNT